jgi:tetratricopeptide (TPR) repeat protein
MTYDLKLILDERNSKSKKFIATYPEMIEVIDSNLYTGKGLISILTQLKENEIPSYFNTIIQKQNTYYENSIVLIVQGQLDEALALLRMASELSRDLLVLSKDPSLLDIWNNREKERNTYRNKFKFNKDHQPNAYAHSLYELTSKFGVHGHQTTLMHSTNLINHPGDHDIVEFRLSDEGIISVTEVWLRAYFAIYANILDCLEELNINSESTSKFKTIILDTCVLNGKLCKHLSKVKS